MPEVTVRHCAGSGHAPALPPAPRPTGPTRIALPFLAPLTPYGGADRRRETIRRTGAGL
ncbi:hypothetical protein [Planobispora takensis]|uniref:Uncharacterized protein n=1 Tax=Planobispora takensis TaxID=1367882 RepID=A0A8J3WQ34_9ACTN|nr:hypothetical protein [Planobispora takensis]GIH98013.1 hypothetical protein Pta02_00220 [Planobispora takensis]